MFVVFLAVALMFIFVATKNRIVGCIGWILFGVYWLTEIPNYLAIMDYFNTTIMILAFVLFTMIGLTILKTKNLNVFLDVTAFSALSALFYFPFAIDPWLKRGIISVVADQTVALGNMLGFKIEKLSFNKIALNGKYVEIILACTGIESMALFAGATLGVKADLKRRLKAFMISVPVIYILNLFRNVFVVVAYGNEWFGEDSFYIAHHVICKILATIALVLISLGVFRFLPELADLIYNLKEELVEVWKHDRKDGT